MLYQYEIIKLSLSKIIINDLTYYNCCLYSSFYINLKTITLEKIPSFEELVLYIGKENLYSYFIDFIKKFDLLKKFFIKYNENLKDIFDNLKIGVFLDNENNICELLTVIDISKINLQEIKKNNFNSLKNNLSDEITKNTFCILQQEDHFEPITIISRIKGKSNNYIKDFLNSEDRN